jgi:hypothetical protein
MKSLNDRASLSISFLRHVNAIELDQYHAVQKKRHGFDC